MPLTDRSATLGLTGVVFALVTVGGCSRPLAGPSIPVQPVTGSVVVKGKPASQARVSFSAVSDANPSLLGADAVTDNNGRFSLQVYTSSPGIPAGRYDVRIKWPVTLNDDMQETENDRLNGKYNDSKKPAFTVDIKEGPNELPPFNLN